jgi:hypothetical protein
VGDSGASKPSSSSASSISSIPSGGVKERADDSEEELETESPRILRRSGDSLTFPLSLLADILLVAESGCLEDLCFFLTGASDSTWK